MTELEVTKAAFYGTLWAFFSVGLVSIGVGFYGWHRLRSQFDPNLSKALGPAMLFVGATIVVWALSQFIFGILSIFTV